MNSLLTSFIALLVFLLFYILHHRKSQNATTVPIHRSFDPFTAFDVQLKNHFDLKSLVRQHGHHGTTFQLTPIATTPIIYTISPENIKKIMTNGNDFGVEPLRGESMGPFCGRGFLTSDGDAWMASRRMLKPCFGKKYIEDMTDLNIGVERLAEKIQRAGDIVDLQPLLFDMFLDASFKFLLGTDGKDDDLGNKDPPYSRAQFLTAFDSGLLGTGIRIMLGSYRFLVPSSGYLKTCRSVHEWLEYFIRIQMEGATDTTLPNDATPGQKSSMAHNLGGQTDDLEYIRGQVLQSMLASKETTAVLISNAVFLLARHPAIWQTLREEILQHPNRDDLFTFDGLTTFAFLQNILKEALRLYPVFPLNGRIALRDTSLPTSPSPTDRQTTRSQSVPVPKGSTIVMSFYTLHRNQNVFGSDVESFNPYRWSTIHPTQYEFMPFGGGQRACLGREKSQAEAALVIARLAERFERLESKDVREFKPQTGISTCNGNGCKVALYS
ncbi:cytochrome P450 [Lophiotrema nucula]|uniref:Cytochrome P450 n=1 Tax=Lophiotrema nucula TaxID=690887 RepID=A0A6A5Z9Q1_9PLEO|nr:cytochrome P450 [Lophiotrema nucula]